MTALLSPSYVHQLRFTTACFSPPSVVGGSSFLTTKILIVMSKRSFFLGRQE